MTARLAILAALALGGCGTNVCGAFDGQTCIALHLRAAAGSSLPQLDEIDVDIAGTLHAMAHKPGGGGASLPIALAVLPGMPLTNARIDVTARAMGAIAGTGSVMASVAANQHVDVAAEVFSVAGADMNVSLDMMAGEGGVAVGPPCNLLMQSSCGAGNKCTLANNGSFCAPDGTALAGEACSGEPDNCVHGTVCVNGVCHAICSSDSDCTQKAIDNVGPHCTLPLPGVINKACTIACNPVFNAGGSGCPMGTACVYTPSPTNESTDCAPPGSVTEGQPCDNATPCAANLTCILNGAPPSLCRGVCRVGMNGDCSTGDSCQSVGTSYGICCPKGGC